jgi:CubicO group peptidase (beta-lactamase class C family)
MTPMLRTLLIALPCLALLVGCPTPEGTFTDDDDATDPEPTWEALPEALAWAFEDETDDLGAPGAAIAILHGDTLYAQGFGSKHPDGGDGVEPTTLFRIGSVTKMMTVAALLQQVEAGQVSLDDDVDTLIPGLHLQGEGSLEDATLHQLISHQSGVYDHTPIAGGEADARLAAYTEGGLASDAWMMVEPGSFWNYANPNFSLAGYVVEQTDGRWYREVVEQDVWAPLGMDRSMFLSGDVLDDGDYAVGVSLDWTGQTPDIVDVEPDSYDDAWSRPAGFAWSTALDLVTFGSFLLDGDTDVLSDALRTEMVSTQVNTLSFLDRLGYGYGTMQWEGRSADGDWYEVNTLEHGGAIPGFAAELITVPEADLVIATLASTNGAYYRDALGAALEELLGETPAAMPDLEIDPDDFGAYLGTYAGPPSVGDFIVTQDGDELKVEMPLLDQYDYPYTETLYPQTRDNFVLVLDGSQFGMTFIFDEDGDPARWFRGRYFVGIRDGTTTRSAPLDRAGIEAFLGSITGPTVGPALP